MILLFIFLPLFSFAEVIKDDVATTDKIPFSFRSVCDKMVTHEAPLIEVVSGTELDCMGKKVSVMDFCDKEMIQDPYYLRAYIDRDKKEVVCHSGKKVIFKYRCTKNSDKHLCTQKAKVSCLEIKMKLARRLDLVHSSVTKSEQGINELNCSFESLPLKKSL